VCSCDGKDTGGEQAIPLSLAEPAPPQRPGSFPSWAEDGRAIIFESRNEIMRLDARAPAKPPRSLASGTEPEVSPDGRFVAHLNDALGLSVLELSTGKRRQVVGRMGGVTTAFAWSPDSEQLAYPGLLPSRPPNVGFVEALFVVGRDGKGADSSPPVWNHSLTLPSLGVWKIHPDSSAKRKIAERGDQLAWQPNRS
jgi:hypothetical protein